MPDILIRGLEMPQDEPLRIYLHASGRAYVDHGATFTEYEAVELPEHGELIDLDERVTKQVYDQYHMEWNAKTKTIRQWLNVDASEMTVVIPANKERSEDA